MICKPSCLSDLLEETRLTHRAQLGIRGQIRVTQPKEKRLHLDPPETGLLDQVQLPGEKPLPDAASGPPPTSQRACLQGRTLPIEKGDGRSDLGRIPGFGRILEAFVLLRRNRKSDHETRKQDRRDTGP